MGLSLHLIANEFRQDIQDQFAATLESYGLDALKESAHLLNRAGSGVWGPHRLAQTIMNLIASSVILQVLTGTDATITAASPDTGIDCHG